MGKCNTCRYWSEMLAMAGSECNGVEAVCINPKSKCFGKYQSEYSRGCDEWEFAEFGAVDSPGGNPYEADNQPSAKEE